MRLIPAASRALVAAVALLGLAACTSSGSSGPSPIPIASVASSGGSVVSVPPATAAPTPDLSRYYAQHLTWKGCGGSFECTTLTVPLDYAKPGGQDIRLAVIRLKASGKRLGSLLVNPGGPGASGVASARAARVQFGEPLRETFDIVGFDPRGVGDSAPVRCLSGSPAGRATSPATRRPTTRPRRSSTSRRRRRSAPAARTRAVELLPHVSTIDAARDMDVLRAALGDKQLYYLGSSYGTYLGATYAGLFPSRVGRLVLDGALDPTLTNRAAAPRPDQGLPGGLRLIRGGLRQALGLPAAQGPGGGGGEDRRAAQVARREPDPDGATGRPLTEGLATLGISEAMYAPEYFSQLLRPGFDRRSPATARRLLRLADFYTERAANGTYPNLLEANLRGQLRRQGQRLHGRRRRAGQAATSSRRPRCSARLSPGATSRAPVGRSPRTARRAIHAKGAAPILVVGTTRDPATPYAWAQALASQLDSGRLLTFDGDGHTGYNRGSSCINRAVEKYLIQGVLPAEGLVCT